MLPDRAPGRRRRLVVCAACFYLLILGVILLWPAHLERTVDSVIEAVERTVPPASGARLDVILNVALFLPFGVILAGVMPRRPWRILAVSWVVPLLVEIFQGVFLPGRVSSAVDVAANTLGGVLGAAAVGLTRRWLIRRTTRKAR